ncbi:MAG: hypothetical protein J7J21_06835 [Methanomicrobia archaeon]|nr:hypothetical protein [Methanomicrobia archaeon]
MSLEKFGDSLINFIYSLAKSEVMKEYDGIKVPNSCLAEALTLSDFESPRRSDKHKKGDFVERIVAESWIEGKITERECVEIIKSTIRKYDLRDRKEERRAMIEGFKNLLNEIKKRS